MKFVVDYKSEVSRKGDLIYSFFSMLKVWPLQR